MIDRLRPYLPQTSQRAVETVLGALPIRVRVVRPRQTKHGDHRLSPCGRFHLITINAGGNSYQFLLTLLHEIAHAMTIRRYGRRAAAHGAEWKRTFGQLLRDFVALEAFPETLIGPIMAHAGRPTFSSSADPALQRALRIFETGDTRPTVEDLSPGERFTLDGRTTMIRGELLRKRYRCVTPDGRAFRVAATARVERVA